MVIVAVGIDAGGALQVARDDRDASGQVGGDEVVELVEQWGEPGVAVPQEAAALEPPECVVGAFVRPARSTLHRKLVGAKEGLFRVSYQRAMKPVDALHLMTTHLASHFDQDLLQQFVKTLRAPR